MYERVCWFASTIGTSTFDTRIFFFYKKPVYKKLVTGAP